MQFEINKVFVLLFTITILPHFAQARPAPACPLNLAKMNAFLDTLATYKADPKLRDRIDFTPEPMPTDREPARGFPKWIEEQFHDFQAQTFKAGPLKFFAAANYDNANFDAKHRAVFFGDRFLEELQAVTGQRDEKALPRFIAAHELSHFIQDLSVALSPDGRTVNGLIYDEEKNFDVMDALDRLAQQRATGKITPAEYFRRAGPFLDQINCLHAEVDTYGLLLVKRAGFAYPKELDAWLEQSLARHGPTSDENFTFKNDLSVRLRMAKYIQGM